MVEFAQELREILATVQAAPGHLLTYQAWLRNSANSEHRRFGGSSKLRCKPPDSVNLQVQRQLAALKQSLIHAVGSNGCFNYGRMHGTLEDDPSGCGRDHGPRLERSVDIGTSGCLDVETSGPPLRTSGDDADANDGF